MRQQRVLTGITTTGTPHLGNYVGAIRPAIDASRQPDVLCFYFLADLHSLIKNQDPELLRRSTREIAATWLACGLDSSRVVFYRQSDIPEIHRADVAAELHDCEGSDESCPRIQGCGAVESGGGQDDDFGITMGLYGYPVLMAADILMFSADRVPVGRDQIQHVEMARDIAQRFNHHYGEHLVLPSAVVDDDVAVLAGLDGRKMSKSYGNTIPLFLPEKQLQKHINRIKTNLQEPGEPKNPDESTVFQVWAGLCKRGAARGMRREFAAGIAWGEAKRRLFELVNEQLCEPRARYEELMAQPALIEKLLQEGAERARSYSRSLMRQLREAVGLRRVDA
jgi:tryptophanyl-tRNA synthetase